MSLVGKGTTCCVVRVGDHAVKIIPRCSLDDNFCDELPSDYVEEISSELLVRCLLKSEMGSGYFPRSVSIDGNIKTFSMCMQFHTPLDDLVDKKLPFDALSIVKDVSASLSFLHRANWCHNDVKIGNILVSKNGRALLCDFGLSSWRDYDVVHLKYYRGDPQFKSFYSRDIWRNDYHMPDKIDMRSIDMWMLGCVLFELTHPGKCFFYVDRPTWNGDNAYKRWKKFLNNDYRHLCTYSDVDKVYLVLNKLLNADPDRRPRAHELYALLSGSDFCYGNICRRPYVDILNDEMLLPIKSLNRDYLRYPIAVSATILSKQYPKIHWAFWLLFSCIAHGEHHVMLDDTSDYIGKFRVKHFGDCHFSRDWFYKVILEIFSTKNKLKRKLNPITPVTRCKKIRVGYKTVVK